MKESIINEKNNYQKLNQSKVKVEKEILSTQKTFVALKEENASQKRLVATKESEILALTHERDKLKELLNAEQNALKTTTSKLELESSLRESESKRSQRQITDYEEKLKHETSLRDQVINKLQKEVTESKKENEILNQNNEDFKKENKQLGKKLSKTKFELENAAKEIEEYKIKIAIMNEEKEKLIKTALIAQSDQRKLKIIADRFDNKIENFVKLIYGELTFPTMLKDCTKYSQVKKQGGANVTKWQKRFLILNGNFLLYYASTEDKEPKGIIHLENELCSISKVDLSKNKVDHDHAFTIVKKNSNRSFFFSLNTEEECNDWVKQIMLTLGWPTDEVNSYLQLDIGHRASLRGGQIRRQIPPPKFS